jgi:hypothetical protein
MASDANFKTAEQEHPTRRPYLQNLCHPVAWPRLWAPMLLRAYFANRFSNIPQNRSKCGN